jgi:HEAT repeat protein
MLTSGQIERGDRNRGDCCFPARVASFVLALTCLGTGGCGDTWDVITSRDFHFKDIFAAQPDPLWLAENSPDGDKRARGLRALEEPLQHGGTQEQQDRIVRLLITRATTDPNALCRLAATHAMSRFKDPRVVDGLKMAYFQDNPLPVTPPPEILSAIRCQAIEALGATGHPDALVVIKRAFEIPQDGRDAPTQEKTNERIAAARALRHFPQPDVAATLVAILRTEKDVALRNRANDSLQEMTGRDFPPEARDWDTFFRQTPPAEAFTGPSVVDQAIRLVTFQTRD